MAFEQVTQQMGQVPGLALQARVAALQEAARRQQLSRMDQNMMVQYLMQGLGIGAQREQAQADQQFRQERAEVSDKQADRQYALDKQQTSAQVAAALARAGVDDAQAAMIMKQQGLIPLQAEQMRADTAGTQARTEATQQATEQSNIMLPGQVRQQDANINRTEAETQAVRGQERRSQELLPGQLDRQQAEIDALEAQTIWQRGAAMRWETETEMRRAQLDAERQMMEAEATTAAVEAARIRETGFATEQERLDKAVEYAERLDKRREELVLRMGAQKPSDGMIQLGSSGPLSEDAKAALSEWLAATDGAAQRLMEARNPAEAYLEIMKGAPSFAWSDGEFTAQGNATPSGGGGADSVGSQF